MLRRRALAAVLALAPFAAQAQFALIGPTQPVLDNGDRLATTAWVNLFVNAGLPLASGKIWIGSVGNIATAQIPSGDLTVSNAGVFTFGTVNANVGSFGSATQCASVTVNAKGLVTAASQNVCTPAIASVTGLGTGVGAALAINVGSAGAPVLFNGALGTPSSGVATNLTGTAAGLTAGAASAVAVGAITGLGTGVGTFLATPSSANLRGAITDETGTGLAYFQGGDIGTPSAGVGTNLTGLNATNLGSGTIPAARMPALTGDCTTSAGAVAVSCTGKVAGVFGQLPGETTTGNASAGNVGEYVSSTVLGGSAVPLTSTVPANITSISLTAGDWDVWGSLAMAPAAGTTTSLMAAWISTTSASVPTAPNNGAEISFNLSFPAGVTQLFPVGRMRLSLAATTTVYLSTVTTFAVSTEAAYGFIAARRAR